MFSNRLIWAILLFLAFSSLQSPSSYTRHYVNTVDNAPKKHLVVGFLPYWTITGYTPGFGIDDIVFFDAPINNDGTIDTGNIQEYYSEITRVNSSCGGCLLSIAITDFDPDSIDEVLAYHQSTLIDQAEALLSNYGFKRLNIDFEGMRSTNSLTGDDNTDLLVQLLSGLRSRGINVSIDVSGGVPTVYRDSRIASYIDYVFMMGYDYHWSTASTTGPVSPLESPLEFSVEDGLAILDDYYPKEKIVLGLPLYGYDWPASSCDPYSDTTGSGKARTVSDITNNYESYGVKWDPDGHVPYITYTSSGVCHQIWYENATSLAMKIDYALIHGYGGYGFWALGYEAGSARRGLLGEVFDSRHIDPYIETIGIYSNGSLITVNASGMINVEELNITLKLSVEPGEINTSIGDLGSYFEARNVTVNGDYINIRLYRNVFPGVGASGSGLLLNITTEWSVDVLNATVSGGSWRIPPGEERIVYASIGNVSVNPPPPVPEESGLMVGCLVLCSAILYFLVSRRGG